MSVGTVSAVHLGSLEQIPPGEGRAFDVAGQQVAVFRLRNGEVRAVSAICPHKGGPIADGQIDNSVVLCPLHLNAFSLDTGCSTTHETPLRTYRVSVDADKGLVVHLPELVEGLEKACPELVEGRVASDARKDSRR